MIPRGQLANPLLVVLAIAGVILVIATRKSVTTDEIEHRRDSLLVSFREDDIALVRVERATGGFVLERGKVDEDGGVPDWFLREPVQEEADIASVQELLDTLEFASWTRKIAPGDVDRAAFGLDAPRVTLRLRMGDIGYRIRVGADAVSPPGAAYLEVDGERVPEPAVGIVSKTLVAELDVQADALRERLVMPYVSSSLERLVLEGVGGSRKLRQETWGWRFDGMESDRRVNRNALDRVLLQFARTSADRFIDAGVAKKALEGAEAVHVTMIPKEQRASGVVHVGGRCPDSEVDVVAWREQPDPVGACVPQSVMDGLSTSASELVDRSVIAMRKDEMEQLSISQGDAKLEIARKEAGFVMRHPKEGDVDEEAGNKRLFDLTIAQGEIQASPALGELGLDPARGTLELVSAGDDDSTVRSEKVKLGVTVKDGGLYVQRDHDGAVLLVSPRTARVLLPDSTLVRSTTVLSFEAKDLREIEVVREGMRQRVERHAAGTFTLHEPKGFTPDPALAADVVDRVVSLVADRWVADEDDGSFGLAKPSMTVTVSRAEGEGKVRRDVLTIGETTPGGAFARLGGDEGVFVMPRATVDDLSALWLDRGIFTVEPGEVSKLTLSARGQEAVIEKDGRGFRQTGGGVELTTGRVTEIVDLLSVMRADGAVHAGAGKPVEGFDKPSLEVVVLRTPTQEQRRERIRWIVGSGDSFDGSAVYYARRDGVDATYVIARSKILGVLNAL